MVQRFIEGYGMILNEERLESNCSLTMRAENVKWRYGMVWPVNNVVPILVMPRHILGAISRRSRITIDSLLGPRKDAKAAHARQLAMLIMRETQPNMSLTDIGRYFRRDHTTIIHGIRAARKRIRMPGNGGRQYREICLELGVEPRGLQ